MFGGPNIWRFFWGKNCAPFCALFDQKMCAFELKTIGNSDLGQSRGQSSTLHFYKMAAPPNAWQKSLRQSMASVHHKKGSLYKKIIVIFYISEIFVIYFLTFYSTTRFQNRKKKNTTFKVNRRRWRCFRRKWIKKFPRQKNPAWTMSPTGKIKYSRKRFWVCPGTRRTTIAKKSGNRSQFPTSDSATISEGIRRCSK